MKELDFDELDKAVNSLMTNVPKDPPATDEVKTVTVPSSSGAATPLAIPSTPPVPTPQAPTTPAATPTPAPRPLAARRAGGRFMDVVHPSTDMKKPEASAPKLVSRQGVTIAPSPSAEVSAEATPEAPVPTPTPAEPRPTGTPEPSTHQPPVTSDWPDPLELAAKKEDTPAPVTEPEAGKSEEGTEEKQPEPTPLTSPFLPDTKVEKRPLGGATDNAIPELPMSGTGKEDLTVDDPDAQLPASTETTTPLPAELQGDLVAIESGSAKELPKEAPEPVEPEIPKEEEKPAEETPAPEPAPKKEEEKDKPTGPVSIPQQYREEPSTGDQESGAIYDTDSYHQPLAHPAKKKSGWLWVIWVLLILVLGAGTGAALYFLGII
jgi:hypothetical protein